MGKNCEALSQSFLHNLYAWSSDASLPLQASTDQERIKAAQNGSAGKLYSRACGAQGQHGEAMASA